MAKEKRVTAGRLVLHLVFILLALTCVIPLLLIVVISLSSSRSITELGYTLIPMEWSLGAYEFIFKNPSSLLNAYKVTIITTAIGSVVGLLFSAMIAYALSREGFKYSTLISFLVFFTMLFSAGMIPQYITYTQWYHLKDTLWVLILPGLVSGWNIILLRTYFYDLPNEVLESGVIDGCGETGLFWKIAMPMMKPALATVGLMLVLGFWNEWYRSMIYIDTGSKVTLQYMLYRLLKNSEELMKDVNAGVGTGAIDFVSDTAKMAMAVLAAGPMMFIFPFFQKYFVRGITSGAVKG